VPRSGRPAVTDRGDWIGLAEASRFLGIAGATLRRWADDGRIPVFTTPGGHRRFSRRALQHFVPGPRHERPSLARLGASPERLVRAYHPRGRLHPAPTTPWLERLGEADRIDFRERGRGLVGILLDHLDAADKAVAALRLQEGCRLAAEHGRRVAALGGSMTEAVQGFLQFRTPFLTELAATARRRSLDTVQATELLVAAESAMDQLLLATMTGHSLASARPRSRRPAAGPSSMPGALATGPESAPPNQPNPA
jgi:excisionase family DNA binding protein